MESRVLLCVLLHLVMGSLSNVLGQSSSSFVFTEHPRNINVLKGDSAVLKCRTNTSLSVSQHEWIDQGNNMVVSESGNYKRVSSTPGQYDLEIVAISSNDGGKYYCRVVVNGMTYVSNIADIRVYEPVLENDLSCFVSLADSLMESDEVSFTCFMISVNQNLDLKWKEDGVESLPEGDQERTNFLSVRRLGRKLTHEDHNKEFTCEAKVRDLTISTCTVGALNVIYNPKVTIWPSTNQYEGKPAMYTCNADANPSPTNYTWFVENIRLPMDDLARYRLEDYGRVMKIDKTAEQDNGQLIRCDAQNAVGLGTGYHKIKLDDMMELIGPIVVGAILFTVLILVFVFVIWWRCSPQRSSEQPRHAVTTVWAANGTAIQPHNGMGQIHDGRGKIDGRPRRYRKSRGSPTSSRASTKLDEEELVTNETLEMTQPASPDENTAYVYDGSLPGSRPQTPKLWNIPREGHGNDGENVEIDSGQASMNMPNNANSSDIDIPDSATDVGDGTPNPKPPETIEVTMESEPMTTPSQVASPSVDDTPSSPHDVSDSSVSTFQPIDPPTPPPLPSSDTQETGGKDLVYADLSFDGNRPPSKAIEEEDKTVYAQVDFSRRDTAKSKADTHQPETSNMTTEL